jgi:hypothetical protein
MWPMDLLFSGTYWDGWEVFSGTCWYYGEGFSFTCWDNWEVLVVLVVIIGRF